MKWIDKLRDKINRTDAPSRKDENQPGDQPDPQAGGTVVRAGGKPSPAAALPGARFKPGDEVAGNLQIKSLLGRGGMGEVWLARQTQWDADVALKIPSPEILADPQNRHPARVQHFETPGMRVY